MNCYICGGYLLMKDKLCAGGLDVHWNCWVRLHREEQKRIIEEGKEDEKT